MTKSELIEKIKNSAYCNPESFWANMPGWVWVKMPDSVWAKLPASVWAKLPASVWANMQFHFLNYLPQSVLESIEENLD